MNRTSLQLLLALSLACTVGCGTTLSGGGDTDDEGGGGQGGDNEAGGGEGGGDDGGGGEGAGGPVITPCETPQMACDSGEPYSAGISYCVVNGEGEEEWTPCCAYDDSIEGLGPACQGCVAPWEEEPDAADCETPLVLSFDGRAVEFSSAPGATFNLTRQAETSVASDWPTAATPWLALDLDENGAIDDGGELFGSATRVGDGFAPNGFIALAALDDNADGVIDAADPSFAKLLVWRDADGSRSSAPAELSLASREVLSIDLAYVNAPRCDARGNCEVERATFTTLDSNGEVTVGAVVDVHLRHR